MDWKALETHFSPARVGRYKAHRVGNEAKAASDYAYNLQLSEAMLPTLNVLEIALRNGIHRRLTTLYGRVDWWEAWIGDQLFNWQNKEIQKAKDTLTRRKEPLTPDKILAEMTFGFWTSLFNANFQHALWGDLRLIFTRCPKNLRQRHTISRGLNQIRDLRNRIFHHEPLLWLTPTTLFDQHSLGLEVIRWIDPQLETWLTSYDRLPTTWAAWQAS
jgi:hypothetical protein